MSLGAPSATSSYYRAVGAIFGDWQGSSTLGFFGDPDIWIYVRFAVWSSGWSVRQLDQRPPTVV